MTDKKKSKSKDASTVHEKKTWAGKAVWVLFFIVSAAIIFAARSSIQEKEQVQEKQIIKLALVPSEDTATMYTKWEKWVDYMEKELDVEIEIVEAEDYAAVANAIRYGHADIARFGPFNYVLARTQSNIEPFLTPVKTGTGSSYYYCYIIVRTDSGITDVSELGGKQFAYSDLGSTSGYLYPKYILKQAGIEFSDDEALFTGGHPESILAVKNGSIVAAGVPSSRYEAALTEGVIEQDELTIVYTSEEIPSNAWVSREGFDKELLNEIKRVMLDMPLDVVESTGLKESGYVEIDDSAYNRLRDLAIELELDLESME